MKHYRDQLGKLKMFKKASYIQVLNGQKHERHAIPGSRIAKILTGIKRKVGYYLFRH